MTAAEMRCPICASDSLSEFLRRHQVPIRQNFLMPDHASAVAIARGTLALTVCEACGFVFNRAFDPTLRIYGEGYENTQACSPSFNEYLDRLVDLLVNQRNVRDCVAAEVGCGNGIFLRKLVGYPAAGIRAYGFDPSYVGPAVEFNGRLQFIKRYYDKDCAEIKADVVICRHVIEHVPRPLELLQSIKKSLVHSPAARIFFETPCVEWILRNQVIWDFFYEHCSYFTAESLTAAFEIAGFQVQSVDHVFGGQYLWLEAVPSSTFRCSGERDGDLATLTAEFARVEGELSEAWRRRIESLAESGKVALWGAGAKGVTFANLADPGQQYIDCIADLNPLKQGHFVPGTGHPIVAPADLPERQVRNVILMNPLYRDENLAIIKSLNADVNLIEGLCE